MITKDNVTTNVNAVVYYRVVDLNKAIVNVEDFATATAQLSQTTLRSVAGQAELDELLSEREKLNICFLKHLRKIKKRITDIKQSLLK